MNAKGKKLQQTVWDEYEKYVKLLTLEALQNSAQVFSLVKDHYGKYFFRIWPCACSSEEFNHGALFVCPNF